MSHDYCVSPKSRAEIEILAAAWRQALRIPTACQAPDLVSVLENEMPRLFGDFALVVKDDYDMDEAEGYTEFDPPRIVLSATTYQSAANFEGRGRWTAAHELGHLVLHKSAVPLDRAPTRYSKMKELPAYASAEWQANAFAAAFLMPETLIRDFTDISEIMTFFAVSRTAAENRLKNLGISEPRIVPLQVRAAIVHLQNKTEIPKPTR
ncbi:ImmA/IrrE family metallo-endopeptidase [Mesorhizobium sp. B2-2-4]|uniref:ImmA/IrrE family metallo-endopeptidase n=1 Tax=unclassified Mesorhizobium TaxID=325217 RepID=UPI00112C4245|nr:MULTISPECIES: ImmA/IrrE family metallo-endopeptidase [unclassified Mesorhizobium]TPM54376.1 ImmA/IrrE family metallo-endopeptidase [Mesorhizobium sp. B2-2-4]TPM64412.1 ImmA/IrrE family metallo-endopeptidase [Mesorhizobium sp. B2-2-1]TPN69442.1 ImmA/IrrE family metallo-endopeptidase [Mesorhizobium sp. B1-1-3]